ncbi:hydantoinase/oxoprolinase family protein [Roseomonas marmotae]|uniref:hydantoinase/oxoprolinase family protein n=1 Tax=Roseomonas marmotae TaxID=2768161 RepID=UPI001A96ED2A|nr:hydantoinase/oxoprolinase family protein [Roseomonas marmotae]
MSPETTRKPTSLARVGIDVGGTFTDFVLYDPAAGRLTHHKQPSTPQDPSRAVAEGLLALLEKAALPPARLGLLMHGTTIGLNAIIQRKGARVALVVTEGFRDVLEIGRSRMPSSLNFHARKETPLVPRAEVVEIHARLNAAGQPTRRPDDAELDRVAAALRRLAPDAVALMLINGYAEPEFEQGVAEALITRLPGLPISSAAVIWPEIREYERTLVACMNAAIQPLMQNYFDLLQQRLVAQGTAPPLFITASNGGSLSLGTARARPVETLLSGPASGVMAATRLARQAEVPRIITFDMGGTSSDIAIAAEGQPEFATRTEIGGLPLVLPVVAVSAIGAGGGSILRVDAHGVLKVGPESAGATPGPVAYGLGGTRPTVTDCYLVTGLIDPARFLGGRLKLDRDAARRALAEVAAQLGIEGPEAAERAAWGALRVATSGMVTEMFKTMASRGLDPASFALMPFGGAGPTHASLLAEDAGIGQVVVPVGAATFCAFGAASADLRRDYARSLRRRLDAAGAALLAQRLQALEEEARGWLAGEGGLARAVTFQRAADMRYAGQAYELRVELPRAEMAPDALAEAFHQVHERLYGFRDTTAAIDIGTARLAILGEVEPILLPPLPASEASPEPYARRPVFLGEVWVEAAIHDRSMLRAGQWMTGPAIIEQSDTTTPLLPGWAASVDPQGNLHLTRVTP